MKKINYKFAVGSVILILAGIFYAKANYKFGNVSNLFYSKAGLCKHMIGSCASSSVLTTGGTGAQMQASSVGGTLYDVYNTSTCSVSHKVHFHS